MKLSEWAKEKGISYHTVWRHFKEGKIKVSYQLEIGTIIIPRVRKNEKTENVVV